MTGNLNSGEIPTRMKHGVCNVRGAVQSDLEEMRQFVMFEVGERWIDAIHNGFQIYQEMPIYIAVQEKKSIGFACYDVVRGKKGLLGPMGSAKNN
ncbi:GNAT family N-acetyltransferase, partial [Bacillus pseudomycoides]|nr:GNAT family N-acetyltransferase [Bacillus pseudomycoides]